VRWLRSSRKKCRKADRPDFQDNVKNKKLGEGKRSWPKKKRNKGRNSNETDRKGKGGEDSVTQPGGGKRGCCKTKLGKGSEPNHREGVVFPVIGQEVI